MCSFKFKQSKIVLSIFRKKTLSFFLFLIPLFCFCQNIELYEQFNGKYDYTAFGNTLNLSPNSCNIQTQSSAIFSLSSSQNLISAYLYWSGSGGLITDTYPGDYQVDLNGISISAERTFIDNSLDIKFYGAFADVTDILNNFGNGTYTVSDFDLTSNIFPGSPYCNIATDYGGWSIIVVYQDSALSLNQVNIFDGFESVAPLVNNNNLNIQLTTLNVVDNIGAKIGFLAWEGDASLAVNETLRINGNILSNPPLNPEDNAFNGTNSFTNSNQLYNMDIDFYNIENYIQTGDVSATIDLTSGQDFIIVNNIITVLNTELPDATISFENIEIICNNLVELNYTVFNINSTDILPAGTPIKFYLEENQIGQALTSNNIPIDGQETGTISLTIPTDTIPDPFTITAVVDDGGGGTSTVAEINEDNNEFQQIISLAEVVLNLTLDPDILITNDNVICEGENQVIGINSLTPIGAAGSNSTYQWFFNGAIIPGETGEQLTVTQPGTYQLEVNYEGCNVADDIIVEFITNPIAGTPTPLIECDQTPNDGIADFNLTEADTEIINGQTNNFVTYHETLAQAEAGTDALVSPYTNTVPNVQTIFARLEEDVIGCYDVTQLVLQVDPAPSITDPISDYQLCDNDGDGSEIFDLTSKYDEIVNTLTDVTLTYYNAEADADADTNAIVTPSAYVSSGSETIWVRAINTEGCTSVGFFNLIIDTEPLFTEVPLFQICDDNSPDGFTEFDLDSLTPTIIAGASNLTVSYYLTEVDAEAGTASPLSSPYTNTINPELIWARVEDDITGCYGIFVIELNVISPIAGAPTPLIECDQTPNDGIADFNLTEADTEIINGQTNNFVTYHETLAQAEAGTDALVSPYTNTVPNVQTIFARLEEDVIGCYDVTQLVLQVDPAPSITDPISDYQLCDNDGDGSEIFDLTSKYDEIVNTLTDVTLTYYNAEADANADTNAIVTPSAYVSSGSETIWVRLSDNFTQCYIIGSFQIETIFCPLPDATISINNDLYACRNRDLIIEYRVNNIDGTAILPAFTPISFYLDEILVTQTQTLNDIPINGSETNSIEINLPINTPNLFEILIRVDDLGFSEGIIEELDELNNEYSVSIEFGSLPPILPLSNLIECDEGNESANFNLTQQNNSISTNTNDIITFYVSEEDANLSENEITDTGSYQNTSNPQTIYIRLENEICFTTSSFEIETENCIPFIPEGFSPNNDNINDVFEIDHLLNVYLDFELKIFSRYGNIIYKGTHKDGFWDGISNEGITFKHQLVPTGVYIYVLQLNDYRYPDSFIGTVYINY